MKILIGFLDGEGYFDIGPQKQYNQNPNNQTKSTIRIRLGTNLQYEDKDLLELIVKRLGVGKIDYFKSKNQIRLIFYKKDILNVIYPYIQSNGIEVEDLVPSRRKQFFLFKYLIENNLKHWEDIDLNQINKLFVESNKQLGFLEIIKLKYFENWLVGFTIAEGSFHIKAIGSAHYSIVQSGIENYQLIKAIHYLIKGPESLNSLIKPENSKVYRISLSSKKDLSFIIKFFDNKLLGLKKLQFDKWKFHIISQMTDSAPNVILPQPPGKLHLPRGAVSNNNKNIDNINLPTIKSTMSIADEASLNKNYLSLIYGLLLGTSFIGQHNSEFKLIIEIESKHMSYMTHIHTKISSLGYCEDKMPLIKTKIVGQGNLNKVMLLHTYYNNNYLDLYNKWYLDKHNKNIPKDIINYFNEESLAF